MPIHLQCTVYLYFTKKESLRNVNTFWSSQNSTCFLYPIDLFGHRDLDTVSLCRIKKNICLIMAKFKEFLTLEIYHLQYTVGVYFRSISILYIFFFKKNPFYVYTVAVCEELRNK